MTLTPADLLLYCGALLILFLTPGPVWLAMMARALSGGFQAAWPLALGVADACRTAGLRVFGPSAEAARLARARFDAGADSFLTVLDAERTLAQTDAALAQAEAQVADLQIQLFKALAGGWAPEGLQD